MILRNIIRQLFLFVLLIQLASGSVVGMVTQNTLSQDSLALETATVESEASVPIEEKPVIEYLEWIWYRLGELPLILVILYAITLTSIMTMLILFVIIMLNRSKMEREKKIREYLIEEYQRLLMDYLFDNGKGTEAYHEIEKVAGNHLKRQVLIDQIMDLMVNLKGDIKEKAIQLYFALGLKQDTMRKVLSRKWHIKIKGYREIAFMDIREASEHIYHGLNSKNEILRMEAQIALVRLSDKNPFEWLHHMKKPLTKWDQITLIELITFHELPVPAFKQWFYSENISILIFALEMIERFEQFDAETEVIALFDHPHAKVRQTAYRVSGNTNFLRSLPGMRERFGDETFENKLEILKSFAKMPDENYLEFLRSVLDKEDDIQLQIQATKAIESTDEPGISMLVKLMKSKSEYKNYQILVRNVLDGKMN
ncbi:MAG: HEAT repeat domain-containing protein [Bacteroidales bacterium]